MRSQRILFSLYVGIFVAGLGYVVALVVLHR